MNGCGPANRKAPSRPKRTNSTGDFDAEPESTTQAPVTGGVFKSAAFEVLKQEQRLMTSGEITKLAMERKLLKCSGKTPEATMASALYTEVRKKALTTVFIKPKEGLFGLKAWLQEPWLLSWLAQEGIDPADLLDPGGGLQEPNPKKMRTSYSGTAARGGGGMGYPPFAGSGQRLPAGPRASLTGLGPPPLGSSGGGGGGMAQRVSYNGTGPVGAACAAGAGGAGGLRASSTTAAPGYGVAPRPPLARSTVSGAVPAAGGATGSVSNLQLLLDAADEIEGGAPEDPLAAATQPARRRSDGVARQSSFQRPRQTVSREPSQPSIIGRARARVEDDDYGEGEGEEDKEGVPEEESHEAQMLRIQQAALHHRQQRMRQQHKQQQQEREEEHRWRRQAHRPHGRGAASADWDADSDGAEAQDGEDAHTYAHAQAPGGGRWPALDEGVALGAGLGLPPPSPGTGAFHKAPAARGRGRSGPGAADMLQEAVYAGISRPDGAQRRRGAQRARDADADAAEGRSGPEGSGEDEPAGLQRGQRPPAAAVTERRGSPGGLPPAGPTPAHRIFMEHKQRGVLPPARRSPLPKAGSAAAAPPPRQLPRGSAAGDLLLRGGSAGSSAGTGAGASGAAPPCDDGVEQLPTTEQVVEQLRAVLASNGVLGGGGFGFGATTAAAGALGLGLGSLADLPGRPVMDGDPGALSNDGGDSDGSSLAQVAAALGVPTGVLVHWTAPLGPDDGGAGASGLDDGKAVKAEPRLRDPSPFREGGADWVAAGPGGLAMGKGRGPRMNAIPSRDAGSAQPSTSGRDHGDGALHLASQRGLAAALESTEEAEGARQQHQQAPPAPRGAGAGAAALAGTASAATTLPSIAVSDAMNSPDSQAAGPGPHERPSPDVDVDTHHNIKSGHAGAVGVGIPPYLMTGAVEAARGSGVSGGHLTRAASLGGTLPLGTQEARLQQQQQQPACGQGSRVSLDGAEARGQVPAAQQQATQGLVAQLALIQKQHLKLLPALEAARPGDVPDPDAINRIRQQVLDMESRMGAVHRETGRAYVLLARVLEHKSTLWSLTMAERALLRAWTILGMGVAGSPQRRPSESSAAAVAGVAAAAAAESGPVGVTEMLGQLPDSFNTFQFLLEQIRLKASFLQHQQQQQLALLMRAAFAATVGAAVGGAGADADGAGANADATAVAAAAERVPSGKRDGADVMEVAPAAALCATSKHSGDTAAERVPLVPESSPLRTLLQQLPPSASLQDAHEALMLHQQQQPQQQQQQGPGALELGEAVGARTCVVEGATNTSLASAV